MALNQILVNIQEKALEDLLKNGSKLCMAKAVIDSHGEEVYNVVAYANVNAAISRNNTITYVNAYSMLGTTQTFEQGKTVLTNSTKALPIQFEQAYSLPKRTKAFVGFSPDAPWDGFAFLNSVDASVVLSLASGPTRTYMEEGTLNCPIFISPETEKPGKIHVTPSNKVALWFQPDLKAATMISLSMRNVHVVDLTRFTNVVITYTDDGEWIDRFGSRSGPIDYTKVFAASIAETTNKAANVVAN
ncbi:hypothetical protein CPB83DRAFT_890251 [Crepidotus variabilis]|uniref:Uncharacterized protein n=1 Tax=Crepidotus variabilis TaxID=179855 RepID=A0A9P6EPR0_9AGAR|nr:hypothetical protein CPB83DRAFT_890251 [Crepidotus variabilis]